jgi:cell division septation protein DedD
VSAGPLIHPDDEARVAAEMTRDLEGVAAEIDIRPPAGFADRVMAAVASEPLPQPTRAFRVALLGGRLRPAIASLGDAWRVAGGGSRPLIVRAQALALVLVVTIGSLAIAGGATVGAIDLLSAIAPVSPPPTTPAPTGPVTSPLPSASPSSTPDTSRDASPDSSPTPEATETTEPTPTEMSAPTERPRTATPRPTPTDDHGDGSGGGGDDSGDHSPAPAPTETDDHGGTDG